jgi:hypothetical protein
MVEMTEAAAILHRATPQSLVLIDEIGRGTSTYDGLALAWAIAHRLAETNRALTLFATHYFELTALAAEIPGCANVHFDAVETPREGIVFMHAVAEGPASRSYGLAVAKLAGVPAETVRQARSYLARLDAFRPCGRWAARLFAADVPAHDEGAARTREIAERWRASIPMRCRLARRSTRSTSSSGSRRDRSRDLEPAPHAEPPLVVRGDAEDRAVGEIQHQRQRVPGLVRQVRHEARIVARCRRRSTRDARRSGLVLGRRTIVQRVPFDRAVVENRCSWTLPSVGTLGPGELDRPAAQAVGRSHLVGGELIAVHARIETGLYGRSSRRPAYPRVGLRLGLTTARHHGPRRRPAPGGRRPSTRGSARSTTRPRRFTRCNG